MPERNWKDGGSRSPTDDDVSHDGNSPTETDKLSNSFDEAPPSGPTDPQRDVYVLHPMERHRDGFNPFERNSLRTNMSRISFHENVEVLVLSSSASSVDSLKDAPISRQDSGEEAVQRPNGGYGWVVMMASLGCHMFGGGILYSFGIFLVEWVNYFGATKGEVAWAGCSMPVMCLVGPLASMMVNKWGARRVGFWGAMFGSLGPLLSMWNPSVVSLYFTFGIWIGLGLGVTYIPCIVILSEYFDTNLPIATGLAVSGAGLGTFIFAPIWQYLIEEFTWKGSLLFMSGALLNQGVCAMLYRPLSPKTAKKNVKKPGSIDNGKQKLVKEKIERLTELEKIKGFPETQNLNLQIITQPNRTRLYSETKPATAAGKNQLKDLRIKLVPVQTCPGNVNLTRLQNQSHQSSLLSLGLLNVPTYSLSQQDLHRRSQSSLNLAKVYSKATLHSVPSAASHVSEFSKPVAKSDDFQAAVTWQDKFLTVLDVRLFQDPAFVLFSFSMFFVSLGYNIPFVFIVDRAVVMGVDRSDAAFLISIAGITNTIGRVIFGIISNNERVSRLHVYAFSCIACGLFTVCYPACDTYPLMIGYVSLFSLSIAGYLCLTSVLLCDLLGVERLANSLGVCLLVQGVGLLVGPPFAGFLYDLTQSYDSSFVVAGILLAASGAVLLPIPLLKKSRCFKSYYEVDDGKAQDL